MQLKRQTWAVDLEVLLGQIQVVSSIKLDLPVEPSPKDQPTLCTSIRSGCHYLVTGDRRDFGHLYDHIVENVMIISLAKFAEVVAQKPSSQ